MNALFGNYIKTMLFWFKSRIVEQLNGTITVKPFNLSTVKRAMAFTLAETLIVMGIIGVVAAITLPNLNSSTGDKERVAKVKKIYRDLQDAYGRAVAVYGPYGTWVVNDVGLTARSKRIGERMAEFMKVSKDCKMLANQGCFTSGQSKFLNGTDAGEYDTGTGSYKIITADGMSIYFSVVGITVDIDGPSNGSFTYGKDIFEFDIDGNKGVIPRGLNETFSNLLGNLLDSGLFGAGWIIRYDNADYLKFSAVDGSTATCTGGVANAVTESHPRCK